MNNNFNDLNEVTEQELSESVNDMIKDIVAERIPELKPDTEYTVKQIFSAHWELFEVQFRRNLGGMVSILVQQQSLPLKHVGKDSSNANMYTISKP
jgi:hypothetical protein